MKSPQLLISGLGLILADQFSKQVASGYFSVTYNPGISFGIWGNVNILVVMAVLGLVAIDAIKRGLSIFDILIISGGLSNVIDRLSRGSIIDWITVFGLWFNLADIAIAIGVLGILYNVWTKRV